MKMLFAIPALLLLMWMSVDPGFYGNQRTSGSGPGCGWAERDLLKVRQDSIRNDSTEAVMGYRFVLKGDFNGDGKQETLTEHYLSSMNGQESPKYGVDQDYGEMVQIAVDKDPVSLLSCDDPSIDTLQIASGGQVFGLAWAKNEGDLDGDGGDELSYVVEWADWSSLNTCHLVSFKKGAWKELFSYSIWDWQLPALPQSVTQYGLFGVMDKIAFNENDSINRLIDAELKSFRGFITPIAVNRIQVRYRNDEAMEDSAVVNLRHPKLKNDTY
jgi:hypothetical protein